jgi:hypothetical protein
MLLFEPVVVVGVQVVHGALRAGVGFEGRRAGLHIAKVGGGVAQHSRLEHHGIGLVAFFGRSKAQEKNFGPQAAVKQVENPLGKELGRNAKQTLMFPHGQVSGRPAPAAGPTSQRTTKKTAE